MKIPQAVAYEVYQEAAKRRVSVQVAYIAIRNKYIQETITLKGQILNQKNLEADIKRMIDDCFKAINERKQLFRGI